MKNENGELLTVLDTIPTRCTIIMDKELSGFHLANAIAVIAMTAGKRHPVLLGADLIDQDGFPHPGLIQAESPCSRPTRFPFTPSVIRLSQKDWMSLILLKKDR